MRILKSVLAITSFALLFVSFSTHAQSQDSKGGANQQGHAANAPKSDSYFRSAIKSKDGVVVVWNERGSHFTVEIKGEQFRPQKMPGIAFVTDGRAVQVITVPTDRIAKGKMDVSTILEEHRKVEVKHWEKSIGNSMPSAVISSPKKVGEPMLWEIRWPPEVRKERSVKSVKHLFLTTIVGTRIVSISHALMEGKDEKAAVEFIAEIGKSLVAYDNPISLDAIRQKARSNAPEGR